MKRRDWLERRWEGGEEERGYCGEGEYPSDSVELSPWEVYPTGTRLWFRIT